MKRIKYIFIVFLIFIATALSSCSLVDESFQREIISRAESNPMTLVELTQRLDDEGDEYYKVSKNGVVFIICFQGLSSDEIKSVVDNSIETNHGHSILVVKVVDDLCVDAIFGSDEDEQFEIKMNEMLK